jgi:hypothetical protein
MITVPTVDSKICNESLVILSILQQVTQNKPVVLNTTGEGPCLASTGLYRILDDICAQFNYPKQNITIRTSNWLERHNQYRIINEHDNRHELHGVQKHAGTISSTKQFDYNFKHFGHFIGHSNRYRLQMASYLYAHQRHRTLQSYHCNVTDEYHRNYMGLEDILYYGADKQQFAEACDLINSAPLTVDAVDSYPILQPANLNITKVYPNIFVEIVSLTFFSGNTFYVDEKIWRPILMKTPFMIQGPQDVIRNFRKLGFKTFHDFWDEGYGEDPDNCHVPAMIQNIQQLAKLSVTELEQMYTEMTSILEHNYSRLLELNDTHFKIFQ